MSSIREAQWQMLKAAFKEVFRDALKKAHASHEELAAPCARAFLRHPILGGVAVEIVWEGYEPEPEQLEEGTKVIE